MWGPRLPRGTKAVECSVRVGGGATREGGEEEAMLLLLLLLLLLYWLLSPPTPPPPPPLLFPHTPLPIRRSLEGEGGVKKRGKGSGLP